MTASISLMVLGTHPERFSGSPSVIRISSSILTPIFHHLGSQGEPSFI